MGRSHTEIPLERVKRVRLFINTGRKTLEQVRAETGADYVLTGGFYDPSRWAPVCPLKADGAVCHRDAEYGYWGYAWDRGPDLEMVHVPKGGTAERDNFFANCLLIRSGRVEPVLYYGQDVGGRRGRGAIGTKGGALCLFACPDGAEAMTPEELRDYLAGLGWDRAVMTDGGRKVNAWFGPEGVLLQGKDKSQNLILVYLNETKEEKPVGNYRVTAAVGLNIRAGADKNAAKLGGYSYGEVVTVLEERNGWARTARGWVSMAWLEPVETRVTDSGTAIIQDIIPKGRRNRPGRVNPDTYITIHETGNRARTADAKAHGDYLNDDAAANAPVSWHYTVDAHTIVQHLPDGESGYHAGDGGTGPGNAASIGIEICVNEGGDFEAAKANAAALVRLLMAEHGVPLDHVVQHNHWSGKDCPQTIRATVGAWGAFLALCEGAEGGRWGDGSVAKAVDKGIIQGDEHGAVRADEPITLRQWCVLADRLGLL